MSTVIKLSKENYMINKLDNLKNSTRKLWQEMNTLMGRGAPDSDIRIKDDGVTLDNKTAANRFNDHFSSIASLLATKFASNSGTGHNNQEVVAVEDSTFNIFELTSPQEITEIVKSFSSKKVRRDEIQPAILYLIVPMIAHLLSHLFNGCIASGVYPDVFKVARVIPLYKTGDKAQVENYRPITTLSIFNKILEKIIHNRLCNFVETRGILSKAQFGFRKSSETGLATFNLVTDLLQAFKNKTHMICMFLDLKKAFDTIDRAILIEKLFHYGVRGNFLELIRSYLQGRTQYVTLGDDISRTKNLPLGIIQGSVLGPLLFNIYINDIVNLGIQTILFADDAVFYVESKSLDECVTQVQLFSKRLSLWLQKNRLTPSESKTRLMHVSPYRKPITMPEILFNDNVLEWVDQIKYLGIIIDNKLTFKPHVDYVLGKLSAVQGITYALKKTLPSTCLKIIYYSLAYSYIIQSLIVWGGTYQTHVQKIAVKMHAITRNILGVKMGPNYQPLVPTSVTYKKLNIMKLEDVHQFYLLKFILYTSRKNPELYDRYFSSLEPIHDYGTRNPRMNLPFIRTEVERHGTVFQCVEALNKMPLELMNINDPDLFKTRFKKFALSKY